MAHARHALRAAGPGALHLGCRPRALADDRRRRHRRLPHPRRQRQPDRPRLRLERRGGRWTGTASTRSRDPSSSRAPKPGDTLAVEILDLHTQGWGWTAILPGLGLLADDFPDPYLRVFDISNGDVVRVPRGHRDPAHAVPRARWASARPARALSRSCRPGPSAATWTPASSSPARRCTCPVQVEGALFSCGDAHGCQGDGEVCVTGLEAPMYARCASASQTGRSIPGPQFRTAGPADAARRLRRAGTARPASGGDLYKASQDAIRAMIDHLGERHGLSARGRLPALQPRASTSRSPRSSTRASTSSARCCPTLCSSAEPVAALPADVDGVERQVEVRVGSGEARGEASQRPAGAVAEHGLAADAPHADPRRVGDRMAVPTP